MESVNTLIESQNSNEPNKQITSIAESSLH